LARKAQLVPLGRSVLKAPQVLLAHRELKVLKVSQVQLAHKAPQVLPEQLVHKDLLALKERKAHRVFKVQLVQLDALLPISLSNQMVVRQFVRRFLTMDCV